MHIALFAVKRGLGFLSHIVDVFARDPNLPSDPHIEQRHLARVSCVQEPELGFGQTCERLSTMESTIQYSEQSCVPMKDADN